MIKIGSLFSGIGGFELGLERAIPNSETIWQVEQEPYCQGILAKHWPNAKIYNDVRNITKDNVEPVDILCGGFPCQDISVAGKMGGLDGERSGLWWEMWRIISELRPRIIVLENVANILRLGGREVLGSLAQIGYDAEWCIVSAKSQGAPHKRDRWFCVAYPCKLGRVEYKRFTKEIQQPRIEGIQREESEQSILSESTHCCFSHATDPNVTRFKTQFFTKPFESTKQHTQSNTQDDATDTNSERFQKQFHTKPIEASRQHTQSNIQDDATDTNGRERRSYWQENAPQSPICRVDDGIPQRVARLKALGNAIVPQCSEWIGKQIWNSGLLEGIA